MSTRKQAPGAVPLDEERLNRLLARWAERRRVSPAQAEAIRKAVIAEAPVELSGAWWPGFRAYLDAIVRQAAETSRRVIAGVCMPDGSALPLGSATLPSAGIGYQAYLKLA